VHPKAGSLDLCGVLMRAAQLRSAVDLPENVHSILDAHYLHRDQRLAESAIRKLESVYVENISAFQTTK
jgi:hypothetical protein